MPNQDDERIIAEDPFNRRLSNVRTGKGGSNPPSQDTGAWQQMGASGVGRGRPAVNPHIEALQAAQHQKEMEEQVRRSLSQSASTALPQDMLERTFLYDNAIPTVFNKRHTLRQLERELKRAIKYQRPLTICVASFNELDMIASNYSVLAQEEALKVIGQVISGFVDLDIETAGRLDDKRFLIVLPEVPVIHAAQFFDEMRRAFEGTRIQHRQYNFAVLASFGIAGFPEHSPEPSNALNDLLAKAVYASDQAIQRGGNTIAFCPRA